VSKILRAIGALFLIIAPIAITYYINRSAPDVRYTLSEKIPVTFADPTNTSPETVQQLEVKNIGNAEANRIVVKIRGQVTDYAINKYSATDSLQIFDQQQPIEFVYSQLPPQAGFKIVFKTASEGVEYNDVTVSHNTGPAREALSVTRTNSTLLSIGLMTFYFILSAVSIRSTSVDLWKSGAQLRDIAKIIRANKPWYFFDSEWLRIRSNVAKIILNNIDVWRDITKISSYQFMTMDKPEHIPNNEWKEISDIAISDLEKKYLHRINTSISASSILDLLNTEKPQYFPDLKWEELEEKANRQYISLRKRDYYSLGSALNSLKEAKPKKISQAAWLELTEYWETQYHQNIIEELQFAYDPFDSIKKLDLSILGNKHKPAVEKYLNSIKASIALERKNEKLIDLFDLILKQKPLGDIEPEEIEEWRWMQLKRIEKQYNDLQFSEVKQKKVTGLFTQLLKRQPIGEEKPMEIDDWEWEQIKGIETLLTSLSNIETLAKQNKSAALGIAEDKTQISRMKDKLERQLHFIDELLRDPTIIDRVEEHDNTFAVGNWANLQKVAQLLSKSKNKTV
jgi:hypothetical protein